MYVQRIRLTNYGPIDRLDVTLPFEGDRPKPVILLGQNGTGKSLLLSHIVNGLLLAKDVAYPDSRELETGKVYKVRSPQYIKVGRDFSYGEVNFEKGLTVRELTLLKRRGDHSQPPTGLSGTGAQALYDRLTEHETTILEHDSFDRSRSETALEKNCALYFPPNHFEEPAWLNEMSLKFKAQNMDLRRLKGYTERSVINYSTLRANQNWLFDLVYDWSVFERQEVSWRVPQPNQEAPAATVPVSIPVHGPARRLYESVLGVIRLILAPEGQLRLGIGGRHNRVIFLTEDDRTTVPNLFQLSSGQTSLLSLFLSLIRDFDLTGTQFTSTADVRGLVVVDEVDLHLHVNHQYDVLPRLMQMFPRVQFIMTSHSPLLVLGLHRAFGESGLSMLSLPSGREVSPEEFGEFGEAYRAFRATRRYKDEMRSAIEALQRPAAFFEGETDKRYVSKAIALLPKYRDLGDQLEILSAQAGGGQRNLNNAWKGIKSLGVLRYPVILVYDCDTRISDGAWPESQPRAFRRKINQVTDHPVGRGIENLFSRATLERAIEVKPDFVDIVGEHKKTTRGEETTVPEKWAINDDEKMNLCDWICENGTEEDFEHFGPVLAMLQSTLEHADETGNGGGDSS